MTAVLLKPLLQGCERFGAVKVLLQYVFGYFALSIVLPFSLLIAGKVVRMLEGNISRLRSCFWCGNEIASAETTNFCSEYCSECFSVSVSSQHMVRHDMHVHQVSHV